MKAQPLSRRRFASLFGLGLGAATAPRLARSAAAEAPAAATPGLVLLDSNENPYGPSPAALDALTAAQAVAARYPDAAGQELSDVLARHHGVSRERVVLGCGSSELLRLADAAFLGPGRTIVAAEPTFEAVLVYARVTKAEPVLVPLTRDFRHDLAAMAAACDTRTGLVYVCNPNNPNGTIVSGAELSAFVAKLPATATVLVDEAYHHFVEDAGYRSATELLETHPNVVVARTFSKIYGMAGLRLGYAVASEAGAKALRAQAAWGNTNASALAAALASLRDEALVPARRQTLNGERRALCAELARDGRRFIPSEANFVMIEAGSDVKPLVEAFRSRGIAVGRRFAAMPTWLRVTIGRPEEMAAFLAALRALLPAPLASAG